jgi:hypothetical protein
MNQETVETLGLCSIFVFLFGVAGFIVASLVTAATVYVNSRTVEIYYNWVKTQMFSGTYLPYYLLTGILFAGLGLFIIYLSSPTDST